MKWMNDATRLANMSSQGHGGFAQVLDPEGQVLLNLYTGVWIVQEVLINKHLEEVCLLTDPVSKTTITSKDDNYTLNVLTVRQAKV